jgi:hypothetical protein
VPMVGKGTFADPVRPLFAPLPTDGGEADPRVKPTGKEGANLKDPGILGFRYELSDDRKTALLELTARDQEALKPFRETKRADVKVFEVGKATKEEIQTEFRKYKPSFDADQFSERGVGKKGAVEVKP